jgi:hypothetical protein
VSLLRAGHRARACLGSRAARGRSPRATGRRRHDAKASRLHRRRHRGPSSAAQKLGAQESRDYGAAYLGISSTLGSLVLCAQSARCARLKSNRVAGASDLHQRPKRLEQPPPRRQPQQTIGQRNVRRFTSDEDTSALVGATGSRLCRECLSPSWHGQAVGFGKAGCGVATLLKRGTGGISPGAPALAFG